MKEHFVENTKWEKWHEENAEWENWKEDWRKNGEEFPEDMTYPADVKDPWQWIGIHEYSTKIEALSLIYQVYPDTDLKEIWKRYGVSLRNDRHLEMALEDVYKLKYNQGLDTIDKYVAWSKNEMLNPTFKSQEEEMEDFRIRTKRLMGIDINEPNIEPKKIEPKKSIWQKVASDINALMPKF